MYIRRFWPIRACSISTRKVTTQVRVMSNLEFRTDWVRVPIPVVLRLAMLSEDDQQRPRPNRRTSDTKIALVGPAQT